MAKGNEQGLKERVQEALEGFLESLEELFSPQPELIPVRVKRPPVPPRRRRRR
ncbi:MAG: hypothetical protein JJ863_26305 [Deltaproteobacteria bacterium]|nr:hypothetical protein [Deltaproteobacteria bacterium]